MKFPNYISYCPREEAKSFFLMKYKSKYDNRWVRYVRPCKKTYDEVVKCVTTMSGRFMLESSCFDFHDNEYKNISDSQLILHAAILGIPIDFIEYEDIEKNDVKKLIDVRENKIIWQCNKEVKQYEDYGNRNE